MTYNYPWNEFADIKFNDNELLNHISLNMHLKKVYDNIYYLNSRPMIDIASDSVSGVSTLATTGEILEGSIDNKSVTPSAFIEILNSIDQKMNFDTMSSSSAYTNITDSIKFKSGEFDTLSGSTSAYIQEIDFGSSSLSFNSSILGLMLYPYTTSTMTSALFDNILCYKYNKDYDDVLSFSSVSTSMQNIDNALRYAYIIYYNELNSLSKIKWTAFGI